VIQFLVPPWPIPSGVEKPLPRHWLILESLVETIVASYFGPPLVTPLHDSLIYSATPHDQVFFFVSPLAPQGPLPPSSKPPRFDVEAALHFGVEVSRLPCVLVESSARFFDYLPSRLL